MLVWRISAARFVANALSGLGAAQSGARWNSRGTAIGYTADTVALAMLELLVHVDRSDVPVGMRLLSFDLPDDAITSLDPLPPSWKKLPYSLQVRAIGDEWARSKSGLALRVPSAVARGHTNVLVNPAHPRFVEARRLVDEPLAFDDRLFAH